MGSLKRIRNVPASVHQRLLNISQAKGINFNTLLQRFAAERFLYRLSASDEVRRFILKGAALFRVWNGDEIRPTRDVDFLALEPTVRDTTRAALEAICAIPCPEDGVVFDPANIRMSDILVEQANMGTRIRMVGNLGRTRLHLQVDIGFGEIVSPTPEKRDYPTLLDLPAPRLWMYPREMLVAEKFHAMVQRDEDNTRVKDLWDIACLAHRFDVDGEKLRTAIEETFRQRQTSFGAKRPIALWPPYYEDAARDRRWQVMRAEIGATVDGPVHLVEVGEELLRFLGPVCDSLIEDAPFAATWLAGGPWRQKLGLGNGS